MECVSCAMYYTLKCLGNLYLFIHMTYIYFNNVYAMYLSWTRHFRFLFLLLLTTKATWAAASFASRRRALSGQWQLYWTSSVHSSVFSNSWFGRRHVLALGTSRSLLAGAYKRIFRSLRVLASSPVSEHSLRVSSPGITLNSISLPDTFDRTHDSSLSRVHTVLP